MTRITPALFLLTLAACSSPSPPDGGMGGGSSTGGGSSAAGGGTGGGFLSVGGGTAVRDSGVTGFIFTGPLDAGVYVSANGYVWVPSDGGSGAQGATLGSACATGNDCNALGFRAGCFSNGDAGFCSTTCPAESDLCTAGQVCVRGLSDDSFGNDIGLCLPACASSADCRSDGGLTQCSGPYFTFDPSYPLSARACFPACAADSDCNGLMCNRLTHRCVDPAAYIGAQCASDTDCSDLGPGGSCLVDTRSTTTRYCTTACDPTSGDVQCVSDYATLPDGGAVAIELKSCSTDAQCQFASSNTCNDFPEHARALCTIRCSTDADCPDGQCDVASGDCRQSGFWATDCAADNNCALGLCVVDFHNPSIANCTKGCVADSECPSGAVCVFSPVALDTTVGNFYDATDGGFCVPSCASDGGVCADPTASCLPPVNPPEIDFAGSGNASANFCWR